MKQLVFFLLYSIACYVNAQDWKWQVFRAKDINSTAEEISQSSFNAKQWIKAPVPGTVARAYTEAGLLEDIRYDDNLTKVDDAFYNSDFWYRTQFKTPSLRNADRLILHFDGINWKAEVYLNGQKIGGINGAFIRSQFDITPFVVSQGINTLAVKIIHNANYGDVKIPTLEKNVPNGGVLGLDNPTFHASIGWDWLPTVPGRNIGIWNRVSLTVAHEGIVIGDAFFDTTLPNTRPHIENADKAIIAPQITIHNFASQSVNTTLCINFGGKTIEQEISLSSGKNYIDIQPFSLQKPQLWWPVGYGDQYLYDVDIQVKSNQEVLCQKQAKVGIRQFDYTLEGSGVQIFVNGKRFIGHGGNWGFGDINLNYTPRDYDVALAFHHDMHLNMVRNWVGQIGDEAFYEACDKYGILVWQDFCLANPADGPDPADRDLFISNAEDLVYKVRTHPCIALFCGRNEGNPPNKIGIALNQLVSTLCPHNLYIPHSADYCVSGYGPYHTMSPKEIFALPNGKTKFHSERGCVCVPSLESLQRMFRPEHQWPQNDVWAMHNFTLKGAQRCATYNQLIAQGLGEPQNLKEFAERAQWINYNSYRAMFESRSDYRNGLLLWMSHPAWPCLVFQTYDYYHDVNGAYFGCKKACAPIHILWNRNNNAVEVVNESAGLQKQLLAQAQIISPDGQIIWKSQHALSISEDATKEVFKLPLNELQLSEIYFVKLLLKEENSQQVIADNFYWEGKEEGNWLAIRQMPKAKITHAEKIIGDGKIEVKLKNNSLTPALMIRLNLVNKHNGQQILPTIYEDNYFSLLGGEEKTVIVQFRIEEHRNEKNFAPALIVSSGEGE